MKGPKCLMAPRLLTIFRPHRLNHFSTRMKSTEAQKCMAINWNAKGLNLSRLLCVHTNTKTWRPESAREEGPQAVAPATSLIRKRIILRNRRCSFQLWFNILILVTNTNRPRLLWWSMRKISTPIIIILGMMTVDFRKPSACFSIIRFSNAPNRA